MSGPKDGKYYILPAANPRIIIGVDGVGNPRVPVITDGKNNVFTVKKIAGRGQYTLVLEDIGGHVFVQDYEGKLVGNETPPPSTWIIKERDSDLSCGPYTITRTGDLWPALGWTLKSDKPKTPVELSREDVQLWNFVPWIGPESTESK